MRRLQRDPALLQSIFDASIEGILVVDDKGFILDANPSCERIFGYCEGELKGGELSTLLPEKSRKKHHIYRKKYLETPKKRAMGVDLNLQGVKKDGTEFPLDISLCPTKVEGKSVTVAYIKDASGRMMDKTALQETNAALQQTNRSLEESNRKYSTLIDSLKGIVFCCRNNRNWTMEYISDGCLPITGYPSQSFLKEKVQLGNIIVPDDRVRVWSEIQKAIAQKQPFEVSYRIRDKTGSVKYINESGRAIFDTNDNVKIIEGFITDVTDQKLLASQLKQNLAKSEALLQALPDTMFIQDFEGNYLDFYAHEPENKRTPKDEIIGKNMKDVLPKDVYILYKKSHKKVIKTGKTEVLEYDWLRSGTKKTYEGRTVPLNQHALLTIVRDITVNKQNEFELRKEKEKLAQYLDTASSIFLVIDKNHKIELVNQKGCEILGYSADELTKKDWFDTCIPEEERKTMSVLFDEIVSGKKEFVEFFENAIITKDKQKKIIQWRNTILKDDSGNAIGVLSSGLDITEQKRTEEQLRSSEAKNKGILNALPDVIILNDNKGTILEIHTPDPDLLMAPVKELIGKNFWEILQKEISTERDQIFRKAQDMNSVRIMEARLPSQKGPLDFEVRIVPLENGKSMSILRDITITQAIRNDLFIRSRALESAGNGILVSDARLPDFPIIYANDAFVTMSGYERNEVIGKNCRFLQKSDRDQEGIKIIRKALENGESCQVELRNYRKNGSLFWNQLNITPVHNDLGELTHFIGVQNNITERKEAEILKDQIRQTLELITEDRPLTEIGHNIIAAVEGHLHNCMASILILDQQKGTLHNLAAPNLPEGFSKGIEGVQIGKKVGSCGSAAFLKEEVLSSNIAADPCWTDYKDLALEHGLKSCWSFPILSSSQKVLGTFAIYCDTIRTAKENEREIVSDLAQLASVAIEKHNLNIALRINQEGIKEYAKQLEVKVAERTKQVRATVKELVGVNMRLQDQIQTTKTAENIALASQALFSAIARNFPKGVISVFNSDMEFVYVEGEELSKIDFERNDFEGKRVDDAPHISKEIKEKIKDDIQKTLSGKQLSFEQDFGRESYAVNTIPLYADTNITWALFVYNNISEQKRVQKELRNALDAEKELNDLKSRFISMASHEFRTPLSAILSSAILIGKQNELGKEEKRKKYVKQIENNVRNMVVILNDFLSLSKLEEGKVAFQPEEFDLIALSETIIDEIENSLKEGQHVSFEHSRPNFLLFLDSKLMRHVLTNLLSNAIKYSNENTTIYFKIENNKEKIFITVRDEGIGIPLEEQENLFGRFFRAKNATNIQGTGLGLHIVKQYTELMGGKVSFKSEVVKGTTFYVEFPVAGKKY